MKEISVQLSRLDHSITQRCFIHCLTAALEDLALKDL
jgi:hypothetical protein